MNAVEVIENLKDPRYFIETFLWVINKDRDKVPFLFNPPQSKYYQNRSHNDLILKARKEGFSTLIEAIWLHACIFEKNTRAVIMSHEMESTKRHFERIRFFLDNVGKDGSKFKVRLDGESQRELYFPDTNSSFWVGTAGSKSFGRGDDITHLHLSEVAHYQNQEVLLGVLEACVPKSYKVMETTANGMGEKFFQLWKEATDPQILTSWKPHFFSWHEDPTNRREIPKNVQFYPMKYGKYDEGWLMRTYKLEPEQIYWFRQKYQDSPDRERFPQEYPSTPDEAFISSGNPVFNLEKVSQMRNRAKDKAPVRVGGLLDDGQKISLRDDQYGPLKVWKMPRKGSMYLISSDIAEGVRGGDWSVAHVFDRSSWEVVAVMRTRTDPGTWGEDLATLGYFFNNAVLIPELNNHGWATVERLKALEYPHVFKTTEMWPDKPEKVGFPTDERNRLNALTAIRNAVDDETITLWDLTTMGEMDTFIRNENGRMEASENCHDDCVMSAAIGVLCLKAFTVDDSYAERARRSDRNETFSSAVASGGGRSRTGYR